MARDEHFDIVVIGGGPNGMTTAAYLAKCGLSVCVLEERTESGGACESVEPLPGVRIYPHAMLMYASAAPGFEQLELHKFGFRMEWDPVHTLEAGSDLACTDGWRPISDVDKMGWAKLAGMLGQIVGQCGDMKPSFRAPIGGLFYVGTDAGGTGIGTQQAIESGMNVADAVERYHHLRARVA